MLLFEILTLPHFFKKNRCFEFEGPQFSLKDFFFKPFDHRLDKLIFDLNPSELVLLDDPVLNRSDHSDP